MLLSTRGNDPETSWDESYSIMQARYVAALQRVWMQCYARTWKHLTCSRHYLNASINSNSSALECQPLVGSSLYLFLVQLL
jgi:hypothetical protein